MSCFQTYTVKYSLMVGCATIFKTMARHDRNIADWVVARGKHVVLYLWGEQFYWLQSSLQCLLMYESKENIRFASLHPLYTHTHTKLKQAQPNKSVCHTVTACSSSSWQLQHYIPFWNLAVCRDGGDWGVVGTGVEAVDHLSHSSAVSVASLETVFFSFYGIFGQRRFGEFRAFSIHMQLLSALPFQQKMVSLIWTDAQADCIIIGHSTGQAGIFVLRLRSRHA